MAGLKQNYTYFVAITFNDRTVNRRNRRGKKKLQLGVRLISDWVGLKMDPGSKDQINKRKISILLCATI